MKLANLTVIPATFACWLFAGSCALDEREVELSSPPGSGGAPPAIEGEMAPGAGVAGGDSALLPGALAAPRLAVGTEAVDLGWVATGFSARARIRVDNLGTAPLPAPTVGFAADSNADFSLIQNECTRDIAPGAGCELRVQLVPSASGQRTATLEIGSPSGGDAKVALNGLGLVAGDLILTPVASSSEDFGDARIGSTLEETFSVLNPSNVTTGPLRFNTNRSEFTLLPPGDGDCVAEQTSLDGGGSCTLRIAFTPSERGPIDATLTGVSDVAGAISVTIAGRGLAPAALRSSASEVDFAGVVLGSSGRRIVSLENAGDEPLILAGARLSPDDAEGFSIVSSDCAEGAPLDGGASCSVQLEFRPPRLGEELTAELVAQGIAENQAQTVTLRGEGLEPGVLAVSTAVPGNDDFGDVVIGSTSERSIQIQNPTAQPSGALDFAVSDGFVLPEPSTRASGECIPGSTSLVDGESCTVRVLFSPSRRETFPGSLTVSSPLAGATALPLQGRGIMPPVLSVGRELNFGRVLTGASGVRALTIRNDGDQPLPPPRLELAGNFPAQLGAFSLESQCSAPLAVGAACDVIVTFAPSEAIPHSATLGVSSAGGDASVLLLGAAQVPGSLTVTAVDGSPEFGDVAIGTTVTRSFSLANPEAIPSGRLTISSDNNRFEVDTGDCNPDGAEGLVDGSSCTFSVRFTPADNLPQVANLSVQSLGAGRAGLQLSGRGRQPAALSATGNRDLGRANVGQDALTQPENEFTWTVNNQGDLATGTLAVENGNDTEFAIRNDSCSGTALAGRASCEMIIRFRPSAAGNRAARVVVTDAGGGRSAALALTGLGVQLAQLGESCVNAECAAGVCTRGVCCDRACDRTCQVCSAQGQCIDQSNQEACGNGAACFGVDNCKLATGGACSPNGGDAQCGSGNCERRLGGSGPGDRICCLDDCGDTLQCNGQGRCQAECTTGQRRCSNGRPQQCNGGFWQDSEPCAGNLTCVNDGQCGCGGATPRQCGSSLCVALDQCCQDSDCSNPCQACNTITHVCGGLGNQPDRCPGSQVCNGNGQCVQCASNADCVNGRPNSTPTCSFQGTCSFPCNANSKECTDGRCIARDECCESCPGRCQNGVCQAAECTPGQRQCLNVNQPQTCGSDGFYDNDQPCPPTHQCTGQGLCLPLAGQPCASGQCASGLSCARNGICCTSFFCTGVCEECIASPLPGAGTCQALASTPECDVRPDDCPVVTFLDEQCNLAPNLVVRSLPPDGEGLCLNDNACASRNDVCYEPTRTGLPCEATGGRTGTCTVDAQGTGRCVVL